MNKQSGSTSSDSINRKLADLVDAIRVQRIALHRNLEKVRESHLRALQTLQALETKLCEAIQPPPEIAQLIARIRSLSPRQQRVLEKVIAGESNKAIAFDLGLSQKTVETHRARVMRKLQAKSLAQLVRIASRAIVVARTGVTADAREDRARSRSA
jgi:two-component system response regulator FixJ